jgi:hypothetical protein
MLQNFAVKLCVDGLNLGDEFTLNNAVDVKKHDEHGLCLAAAVKKHDEHGLC